MILAYFDASLIKKFMSLKSRDFKKKYIIAVIFLLGVFIFVFGIKSWFFHHGEETYYFGEIVQITDSGFIIKGREYTEKIITMNNDTVVRKKTKIAREELRVGNNVIVVGRPKADGRINAGLVRILSKDDFSKYR